MALILETGEGLETADSLVTLAEVRAFAGSRGKTVSAVDATLEASIRSAHEYLIFNEARFSGSRAKHLQALPFPRTGATLHGVVLENTVIPQTLKNAVCQLVLESAASDLLPAADAAVVVSETVGPISTTYAANGVAGSNPILPRVEAWLQPLYRNTGRMTATRV